MPVRRQGVSGGRGVGHRHPHDHRAPSRKAPPEVVSRTGMLVGRAIADVANLLDLRLATVSGSVALGFGQPFFEAAGRELKATSKLSFSAGCRVIVGKTGSSGPLIGAAAVALSAPLAPCDPGGWQGERGPTAPETAPGLENRVVLGAPRLWRSALALVPRRWWRRWPPLPVPTRDYMAFRMETMFGDADGILRTGS